MRIVKRYLKWVSTGTLILLAAACLAVGRPHLDLHELATSADVIAIADVSEPSYLGGAAPLMIGGRMVRSRLYSARVRLLILIKGTAPSDVTVQYLLPVDFAGYVGLQPGRRLVFLKLNSATYEPANPYYPDFPAPAVKIPAEVNIDTDSAVIRELANVLASSSSSASDKFEVLGKAYAIPTSNLVDALKKGILATTDRQLRVALQRELLIRGDVSQLESVVDMLLNSSLPRDQRSGLVYAIGSWVKDAGAGDQVVRLLSSADSDLRIAGAEALWHIADPRTEATLVRLLNDPERNVRYYAVRALAEITGQDLWAPSVQEFQDNEYRYLEHWRKWGQNPDE